MGCIVNGVFVDTNSKSIKPGVQELFEANPELSKIGTPQQYSQYLQSIFPDSKVKDIVYHGSKNKFEKFDKSKLGSNTNPDKIFSQFNDSYLGFHFASKPEYYRNRHEFGTTHDGTLNEYSVLINIKNPKELEKRNPYADLPIEHLRKKDVKTNDSVIYDYLDIVDFTSGEKVEVFADNYIVFSPEQIHILGSKQDIEGFKKFTKSSKTYPTIESSELFRELSKSMTPDVALQTYLELKSEEDKNKLLYGENSQGEVNAENFVDTPKYKLAEFKTNQEQIATMDYLLQGLVAALQNMVSSKSSHSISGINLSSLAKDPAVIPMAIQDARTALYKEMLEMKASGQITQEQYVMRMRALKNFTSYMQTPRTADAPPGLGPLGLKLRDYGINLSIKESSSDIQAFLDAAEEVNDDVDQEEAEVKFERIYDMDILESDVSTTILEDVRIYLRSKRRVHPDYKPSRNKTKQDVIYYQGSEIGHPRPINFNEVIGKLYAILQGVQSPDELISRLETARYSSPELSPIYQDLLEEQTSPVRVVLDGVETDYKPIAAALFTTFAKKDYNMFSIIEEDGKIVFYKANASSVENNVKTRWATNIASAKKSGTQAMKQLSADVAKFINNKSNEKNINNGNSITLREAVRLFNRAGFDNVTLEDIKAIPDHVKANKVRFSNEVTSKDSAGIIKFFVNTLVKGVADDRDIFAPDRKASDKVSKDDENSKKFGESRNLSALAKIVGGRVTDIAKGAFYSNRGSMVHPLNLGSEGQEIWDRLVTPEGREIFNQDPLYHGSSILSALQDPEHASMFEVTTMDVLSDNNSSANGVTFGQLSTPDAVAVKLNGFFDGHARPNYFYAPSPTQGDRGKSQALILPKLGVDKKGNPEPVFLGGKLQDGEIKDWLQYQLYGELNRIARVKAHKSSKNRYDNYTENGVKFNLFTQLNGAVDLSTLTTDIASIQAHVDEAMKLLDGENGILKTILNDDISFLVSSGVVTQVGNELRHSDIGKKLLSRKVGTNRTISRTQIENFLMNNLITTYDQTLLYLGDLAYYSAKSDFAQKADLNKRFSLPFTPGIKPATGPGFILPKTSKVIIIKDEKVDSEFKDVLNAMGDTKAYAGIESADGFGAMSLQRYRALLLAQNKQTEEILAYIDAELAWKPGQPAPTNKVPLEVLKPFYFRLQAGVNDVVAPMNMKYSAMPVIPSFWEQREKGKDKFGGMAAISRALRSGKADEIVMATAVKTGRVNMATIKTLDTATPTVIHNESYRIPQVSPSKTSIEDRFGSQMRVLITGNFKNTGTLDVDGNEMQSTTALKNYEQALKSLVSTNADKVYREFVKSGRVEEAHLIRKLLRSVETNSSNNSEYYKEALTTLGATGKRLLPLNYPTIAGKIDSLINSAFRNGVNRMKLPGHSAVQIPNMGALPAATKEDIKTEGDLNFVRLKRKEEDALPLDADKAFKIVQDFKSGNKDAFKGYSIEPAEIRLTPKFFKYTLEKEAAKQVDRDKDAVEKKVAKLAERLDEGLTPVERQSRINTIRANFMHAAIKLKTEELTRLLTNAQGEFDIAKVRAAGLDMVTMYRIPTQGKSSMAPGRVVGFLPYSAGGSVQIPAEMVSQSGSDFDIDKLYIEMSAFRVEDNAIVKDSFLDEEGNVDLKSERAAKAYITEFHRAVLTSPDYFSELVSTNGAPTLTKLAEQVGTTDSSVTSNFATLATQEVFRANNKAGGNLISISSIASVAHTVAQRIGSHFKGSQAIAGVPIVLGNEKNLEGTMLISKEIEEIQTASLDNAKDPLLGKLNIDEFTASVVLLLVSAGHGLEFATTVVNAPIVKELAALYPMYSRKNNQAKALTLAIAALRRKHDIKNLKTESKKVYTPGQYTLQDAKAAITNSEKKEYKAGALQAFLDLKELGDSLQKFQIAMNFGSKGTPSTVAGLLKMYEGLAGIPGTLSHNREFVKTAPVVFDGHVAKDVKYNSVNALRKAIFTESKKITLDADGKAYTYKDGTTTKKLDRVSSYVKDIVGESSIKASKRTLDAANTAGSYIDTQVRNFFLGKPLDETRMSPQAFKNLKTKLEALKARFDKNGEYPITGNNLLKVYDLKLNIAGEMDLLTIDNKGNLRIYDVKSERSSTVADYQRTNPGMSTKEAQKRIDERFEYRGTQLNTYRGLLRNMVGVRAIELNIVPIGISYENDGAFISEIRTSKELLENHEIVDDLVADTRNMNRLKDEKLKVDMALNIKESPIGVDPIKYAESHLSQMEKNSVHDPLKVNRMVSPAATIQMQKVLKEASKAFGYLTDKQMSNVITDYYTYLATNSLAVRSVKSTLSKRLATKEHLNLVDRASSKCLANMIEYYRSEVKLQGGIENPFIEALNIIEQDGRAFVAMSNTYAKGLTGEAKMDLMAYFEDLMDSPKNSIEAKLAKALADYAIIYYGFSKGLNSFMEFIPPRAHDVYMGSSSDTTNKSLPDFFREVSGLLDNPSMFNNTEGFITMFAQNNAHKLSLTKISKSEIKNSVMWEVEFIESNGGVEKAPKFVIIEEPTGPELGILNGYKYDRLPIKGVKGFAVEYREDVSVYRTSPGEISGASTLASTSEENKEAIDQWKEGIADVHTFFKAPGDYMELNTDSDINSYLSTLGKQLDETDISPAEVKFVKEAMFEAIESAKRNFANGLKRNSKIPFKQYVSNAVLDTIDYMIVPKVSLTQKLKFC